MAIVATRTVIYLIDSSISTKILKGFSRLYSLSLCRSSDRRCNLQYSKGSVDGDGNKVAFFMEISL